MNTKTPTVAAPGPKYEITQIPHEEAQGPFRFVVWEWDAGRMKFPLCVCYMEDGAREIIAALQALAAVTAAQEAQAATKKAKIKMKSLSTEDLEGAK